MKKIIGVNYLHSHPQMEKNKNVDEEHVIVDKSEWVEVVNYFRENPSQIKELGKKTTIIINMKIE